MKHNTHIYLAAKAIEFTYDGVDNTVTRSGAYLKGKKKGAERRAATERQRILRYYKDLLFEATWAPDDVLKDNDPYHIFKLFTDDEFPGHGLTDKQTFEKDRVVFHKFAGGLPFRADHIAQEIINMAKLRDFNDQFDNKQIMYQYLLLSHYLADAHVPMHCDLRDDPPKARRDSQPSRRSGLKKPAGAYMKSSAHNDLETLWDNAVTPVAVKEDIRIPIRAKDKKEKTAYSDAVTFTLKDCRKQGEVRVPIIPKGGLLDFMIDICIESKKRGQILFPVDNPKERNDAALQDVTRTIFADCIGNLMAVWRYIWFSHHA